MPVAFSMSARNGVHSVFRASVDSVDTIPKLISLGISARAVPTAIDSAARAVKARRRVIESTSSGNQVARKGKESRSRHGAADRQPRPTERNEFGLALELGAVDVGEQCGRHGA